MSKGLILVPVRMLLKPTREGYTDSREAYDALDSLRDHFRTGAYHVRQDGCTDKRPATRLDFSIEVEDHSSSTCCRALDEAGVKSPSDRTWILCDGCDMRTEDAEAPGVKRMCVGVPWHCGAAAVTADNLQEAVEKLRNERDG